MLSILNGNTDNFQLGNNVAIFIYFQPLRLFIRYNKIIVIDNHYYSFSFYSYFSKNKYKSYSVQRNDPNNWIIQNSCSVNIYTEARKFK